MAFGINFFSKNSTDFLFLKSLNAEEEVKESDEVSASRFINSIFVSPRKAAMDDIDKDKSGVSIFGSVDSFLSKSDEEKNILKRPQSFDSIDSNSQTSNEPEAEQNGFDEEAPLEEVCIVSFRNSKVPASKRICQKSRERVKDIIQERDEPEVHWRYFKALESDRVLIRHKLMLLAVFKHQLSK